MVLNLLVFCVVALVGWISYLAISQSVQERKLSSEEREKLKQEREELAKGAAEYEKLKANEKLQESTTEMRCLKCYSDDIFVMGENKKSFSVKKAVAGTVLTGGVGAIAGFAGKKNGYDCYCGDCKHRFLLKDK